MWQLVEHIRIAQADILEFCTHRDYRTKKWPDDYWPSAPAPRERGGVDAGDRGVPPRSHGVAAAGRDPSIDLFAPIPHGSGQTYLREMLLVADHTAHHVGQLIAVRRLLGIWK